MLKTSRFFLWAVAALNPRATSSGDSSDFCRDLITFPQLRLACLPFYLALCMNVLRLPQLLQMSTSKWGVSLFLLLGTESNPWVGDGERNRLVPMYMTASAVCVKWPAAKEPGRGSREVLGSR